MSRILIRPHWCHNTGAWECRMMDDAADLEAVIRSRLEQGRFRIERADPAGVMEDLRRTTIPWNRLVEEARRIVSAHGEFDIVIGESRYHYEQVAAAHRPSVAGSSRLPYDITSHVYRWAQADADDYDQSACQNVRVFDGVEIRIVPPR